MSDDIKLPNDGGFSENDKKLMAAGACFVFWLFAAVALGLPFLEGDSGLFVALRALLIFSGFGFAYWMIYAKRGPGLDGIMALAKALARPFTRMPETKRRRAVVPVFALAILYIGYTAVWLMVSDEAAQKRALFNTYDGISDVQWFHHGDSIDLYVYSETLDTLYEDALTNNGDKEADLSAGVHIRYSDEIMQLDSSEFASTVREDIIAARTGKLDQIHGKADIGVHEVDRSPIKTIAFHGAFGITGHGFLEILVMCAVTITTLAMAFSRGYHSYHMVAMSVLLLVLASSPDALNSDMPEPQIVEVISADAAPSHGSGAGRS